MEVKKISGEYAKGSPAEIVMELDCFPDFSQGYSWVFGACKQLQSWRLYILIFMCSCVKIRFANHQCA